MQYVFPVNVKDHGASGDGSTDDTSTIENAINAVPTGGILYFPPGTYIVDGTAINLPSNATVKGAAGTTIKLKSDASSPKFCLNSNASADNITVKELTFDINGNSGAVGLAVCKNMIVENCVFTDTVGGTGSYGIHANKMDIVNLTVHGCTFKNIGRGFQTRFQGNDVSIVGLSITNCYFKDLTATGIALLANNSNNSLVQNVNISACTFDTIGSDTASAGNGIALSGALNQTCHDITITGNTFYRCDMKGVHVEQGVKEVVIANNVFQDIGYGWASEPYPDWRTAIYVAAAKDDEESPYPPIMTTDIVISSNIIIGGDYTRLGIVISGTTDHVKRVAVIGNQVRNARNRGISVLCDGANVSNNVVSNTQAPHALITSTTSTSYEIGPAYSVTDSGSPRWGVGIGWDDGIAQGMRVDVWNGNVGGTLRCYGYISSTDTDNYKINVYGWIDGTPQNGDQATVRDVGSGIQLRCKNAIIYSNRCFDDQDSKTQEYGIIVGSTGVDKVLVQDNIIKDNSIGAIKKTNPNPTSMTEGKNYTSDNSFGIATFSNNDATPSVQGNNLFKCATGNTSALNVTFLDDGYEGQIITILGANPTHKTTIKDTTNMYLNGDWVEESEATLTLFFDGTAWYEISRRHS